MGRRPRLKRRTPSTVSASMTRTPASAGNQKTWTVSVWVKFDTYAVTMILFLGGHDSTRTELTNQSANSRLRYVWREDGSAEQALDSSYITDTNWHHICVNFDTTQSTSTERYQGWIDGTKLDWDIQNADEPGLNKDYPWNEAGPVYKPFFVRCSEFC